jgi:hypothetical protein
MDGINRPGSSISTDPYTLSTGPKSLATVFGGENIPGGISGYDAAETTDEDGLPAYDQQRTGKDDLFRQQSVR